MALGAVRSEPGDMNSVDQGHEERFPFRLARQGDWEGVRAWWLRHGCPAFVGPALAAVAAANSVPPEGREEALPYGSHLIGGR
jgi:hypothetical protein